MKKLYPGDIFYKEVDPITKGRAEDQFASTLFGVTRETTGSSYFTLFYRPLRNHVKALRQSMVDLIGKI